ncbi:MAG: ATP-dependent endonuclease [Caldilineaceae bacterium]|nr:ATP-dependent endonuclease [Caldilineaceae bacterium]
MARELGQAMGRKGKLFTADTLEPRLRSMMTPWMGEGFFADVVVLVEGEDDRAAILSFAKSKKCDFDGMGIAVIPCFGKSSIDRPLVIFRQLGISVYVVWDGDRGGNNSELEVNKRLLRLLRKPEQDWPHFVSESSACFKVNLERQ